MPGLAAILGNPVLEQLLLYNVVGQLIGAALGPYLQALTNEVQSITPLVPLSPADLALAVIRNELTEGEAADQARLSGIDPGRFHTLTRLTGDAPAPEALAVALRRGFVDEARYLTGVRQGRMRDEWADTVKRLATSDPPETVALLAELKGQADHATAVGLYQLFGGNPDHYELAYNVEGAGPSPLEAATAARRGIIPWDGIGAGVISFAQAVHESAYRNKWEPVFRVLSEYLPPPRTVTAMHREGALTDAQAAELFAKAGLPPDLAAAYLASSHRTKTAKVRELSESTVLKLYTDRLVDRAQAGGFLEALGYSTTEATFILDAHDLELEQRALTAAHARIHTLYVGHKITAAQAAEALAVLGVDAKDAAELLTVWGHERAANLRHLTPAEIAQAFGLGLVDQAGAQALLEAEGFTPWDAWALLSIHHKAPLPDQPAMEALPAGAGP